MEPPSVPQYCLIVAIDFGTSYSGVAYSNVGDQWKHNKEIYVPQCWKGTNSTNGDIKKTKTCILFDKNQRFLSFGHQAEDEFAECQGNTHHSEYLFFRNYKMHLYDSKIPLEDLTLSDEQGKQTMLASIIVTESIKALIKELMEILHTAGKNALVEEILWVLTVPAIWPEDSKSFMRKCAVKAGLPDSQLLIALEPEAASIYCQFLKTVKSSNLSDGFKAADPGTKYMVVDIGGGTTDITLHEKKLDNGLKELHPALGTKVGGCTVDLEIIRLLEKLLTRKLLTILRDNSPSCYLDLYRECENVKRNIVAGQTGNVSIKIPRYTLESKLTTYSLLGLKKTIMIPDPGFDKNDIKLVGEKLYIDVRYIKDVLRHTIFDIKRTIENAFKSEKKHEVFAIILVGGLSQNKYVQANLQNFFHPIKVIVPEDAILAVLKGAVLYGHNPEIINPRMTRYTYGTDILEHFNKDVHDLDRFTIDDYGNHLCKDSFCRIIQQNTSIPLGKTINKSWRTLKTMQARMSVDLYESTDDNPIYIDNCRLIGKMIVDIPKPSIGSQSLSFQFIFGDTEIKVKFGAENQTEKTFLLN